MALEATDLSPSSSLCNFSFAADLDDLDDLERDREDLDYSPSSILSIR
jgi:hypothetical protein